jgi:uncharacterized protein YqeY
MPSGWKRKEGASDERDNGMSLRDELSEGIQRALRGSDKQRLSVLRMLLSELEIAETSGGEVDESAVVRSYARKLRKTADQYKELNLPDEARKAETELAIVEELMPRQMEPSEVEVIVARIIEENDYGPRDLGRVMKAVMAAHGDSVDGRLVQEIAQNRLAEQG